MAGLTAFVDFDIVDQPPIVDLLRTDEQITAPHRHPDDSGVVVQLCLRLRAKAGS